MADCFYLPVGGLRVHGEHTRVRLEYGDGRVEYVSVSARSRGRDSWTLKKLEKLSGKGVKMSIAVVDGGDVLSPWFDFDPEHARGGSSPWRRLTGRDANSTNSPLSPPEWQSEGAANARDSLGEWVNDDPPIYSDFIHDEGFSVDAEIAKARARHQRILMFAVEGLSYGKSAGVREGNARQMQWILEQEDGEQTMADALLLEEDNGEPRRHRAMLIYRALADLNDAGGGGTLDDHPELCAAVLDSSATLFPQFDSERYGIDRKCAEDLYDDALSSVLAIVSTLESAPSDYELEKSAGERSRHFTRLVRKALDEEPVLGGLLVPEGSTVRIDARRALWGESRSLADVDEFSLVSGPAPDNGTNIVNVGRIRHLFESAENVEIDLHGVTVTIPSVLAGSRSPQTLGRVLETVREKHGMAAAATVAAGQLLEVLAGGGDGSDDRRWAVRRVEVQQRLGFSMEAATGARWRTEDRRIEALESFVPEGFAVAVDSLLGGGRLAGSRNQPGAAGVAAETETLRLLEDATAVLEGRRSGHSPAVDGTLANVFTAHLSTSTAPVAGPVNGATGNIPVDDRERLDRARKLARESDWATALTNDPAAVLACPEAVRALAPATWMAAYCSIVEGPPVVNLTPHSIDVVGDDGVPQRTYPPAGLVRAKQVDVPAGNINGIPVVRSSFGEPSGVPAAAFDPSDPTRFLVSRIAADAMLAAGVDADRIMLPAGQVVDSSGKTIGARRFARPAKSAAPTQGTRDEPLPATAELVNLTPRDISFYRPGDGASSEPVLRIPASGSQARAATVDSDAGTCHGRQVVVSTFGPVEGLPPPRSGVFLIVSLIAANAALAEDPTRRDLLVTSGAVRGDDGAIVGVTALAVP